MKFYILLGIVLLCTAMQSIAKLGHLLIYNYSRNAIVITGYYSKDDNQHIVDMLSPNKSITLPWIKAHNNRLEYIGIVRNASKSIIGYTSGLKFKIKTTNNGVFATGKLEIPKLYQSLSGLDYTATVDHKGIAGGARVMHLDINNTSDFYPSESINQSCENIKWHSQDATITAKCKDNTQLHYINSNLLRTDLLEEALNKGLVTSNNHLANHNGYLYISFKSQIAPVGHYFKSCKMVFYDVKNKVLYAGCPKVNQQNLRTKTYVVSRLFVKNPCYDIINSKNGMLICKQ